MAPKRKASAKASECNGGAAASEHELSLEHVRRTAEYLSSLGLGHVSPSDHRYLGAAASRSSTTDEGAEEQEASERVAKRPRSGGEQQGEGDDRDDEGAVEAYRGWLRASRVAIASPGLGAVAPADAATWRAEAVRRWGDACPPAERIDDWRQYVLSRLASPPPPSPCCMEVMQEKYAYDPWRLLAACLLMTRINSERVKAITIASFFQRFSNPSVFLAVAGGPETTPEYKSLQELLRPVGLVDNRIRSLLELTRAFLHMPSFDCGHQKNVNKIWGCGAFAVDSYLIFCRGQCLAETADASCQQYLDWWRGEGNGGMRTEVATPTKDASTEQAVSTPPKPVASSRGAKEASDVVAGGHPSASIVQKKVSGQGGLHRFFKAAT